MRWAFYLFFLLSAINVFGQFKKQSLENFIHDLEGQGYFVSYDPDASKGQRIKIPKKIPTDNRSYWTQISAFNNWEFLVSKDSSVFVRQKPEDEKDFHCFVVIDKDSREVISDIIYEEQGVQRVGTSYGYFSLFGDSPDSISVFHGDYGRQTFEVIDQEGCQEIAMRFLAIDLDLVDLSYFMTKGIVESSEEHVIEITPEELSLIPGQEPGDVFQVLNLLPGVNSASGNLGSMSIRGCTPDQTLTLVDDIPVYYSGHVYGTLSPYQTDLISSISVHRDGGTLDQIDKLGGLINMKMLEAPEDSTVHILRLNSTLASYALKAPIVKNKVDVNLGIRSWLPIGWESPRTEAAQNVGYFGSKMTISEIIDSVELHNSNNSFMDYSGKLRWQMDSLYSFEFSSISYRSVFDFNLTDYNLDEEVSSIRSFQNIGFKSSVNKEMNKSIAWRLVSTYSDFIFDQNELTTDLAGTEVNLNDRSQVKDFRIQFNTEVEVSDAFLWKSGVSYNRISSDLIYFENRTTGIASVKNEVGKISSAFTSGIFDINKNNTISAGVKANHFNESDRLAVLPRIKFMSDLAKTVQYNLSIGASNQYLFQPISFDFNDSGPDNQTWFVSRNHESVLKAQFISTGLYWNKKGYLVEIEGYYKNVTGLVYEYESNVPGQMATAMRVPSENLIGGIDFVGSYNSDKSSYWVKYSYSSIKWDVERLTEYFSAYYEQPHSLALGGAVKHSNYTFSLGWSVKSGVPNQDVNISGAIVTPGPPPMGGVRQVDPYVDDLGRYPVFHQLDVSMSGEKQWGRGSQLTYGLAVLNLYDRKNHIEVFRIGRIGSGANRYTTRISPEVFMIYKF